MKILRKMFSLKWLATTFLVVAGAALCIRLGIWQLDRLDQRRVFNAQVESMHASTPLNLNDDVPADITSMEWRTVTVTGQYDFENQIALRNQYYESQYGYHLVTPLLFDASNGSRQAPTVILVERGWIPADSTTSKPEDWRVYDEPGQVTVTGQLRLGQSKPAFGGVADALPEDGSRLAVWNNIDLKMIASQFPYPILEVFIQPNVDAADTTPPIPFQPELDLTEGPHFGYALQWFAFSAILLLGYPFYLRKQDD